MRKGTKFFVIISTIIVIVLPFGVGFLLNRSEGEAEEAPEIVMYHNGTGPMCLEAIEFFEENEIAYEEHLTTDENFRTLLDERISEYGGVSEGVSESFGYYPMIFVGGRAFSGFDDGVELELRDILNLDKD